ncbi:MAG TPA: ATP-binding protein [Flavobacteriales bacterium]|nr:ATP-binding protein [Flavobacteriales bacterium]
MTSPFKFLDSYALADHGTFFGRDRESGELFRQCFTGPILVVYGGSGTGKTSLVQCGLAARFLESDWLPILVRRSGDMLTSLIEAVEANTLTASTSSGLNVRVANLYLDHFKPIYFIFDQFEELFIFGKQQESEAFFSAIHTLLEAQRNVHAIFIVREEYLAELTRYEHIVPGLIENRYRVERMARSHAVEVVEKLCAANGIQCSGGFSAAMVDRLNPEGHGVELSYLQVYLDRCWRSRQNEEPFSIALLERIGYVDDLLGAFLDEQVADTPEPESAEALLKTFVSDQGTKRQLTTNEAHEWVNAIGTAMEPADVDRLLQVFVTKRLLKDRDERGRYELLHDALARQIFQRITRAEQELIEVRQFVQQAYGQYEKRGAKLTANDLTYLRPYRGQLHLKGEVKAFVESAFGEEERRVRRKKLRSRLLLGGLVLLCLIGGKLFADLQKRLDVEQAINESGRLAEKAMELTAVDPYSAYLVAEEAYARHPGLSAERALIHTYQFLMPMIARFKGNDVRLSETDGSITIINSGRRIFEVYDSLGNLRFEHASDDLSWDSFISLAAGRFSLAGKQNPELIDLDGNVVHKFAGPIKEEDYDDTDSSFWVRGPRELVLWKLGSSEVNRVPIDTTGSGRWLASAERVCVDASNRWLVAVKDDSVFLATIGNGVLELHERKRLQWSERSRNSGDDCSSFMGGNVVQFENETLDEDWITDLMIDQDKVVIVGQRGIWQALVNGSGDLVHQGSVDFQRLGIDLDKESRAVLRGGRNYRSMLVGYPHKFIYTLNNPGSLKEATIPSGYFLMNYEDSSRRVSLISYDYRGDYPTGMTAALDGSNPLIYETVYQIRSSMDVLVVVKENMPENKFELQGVDMIGRVRWTYRSDAGGKLRKLYFGSPGKIQLIESVTINGMKCSLVTAMKDGIVQTKTLIPRSLDKSIETLGASGSRMIVAYSDSVIMLVDHPLQMGEGVPNRSSLHCQGTSIFSSSIIGDSLHSYRTGPKGNAKGRSFSLVDDPVRKERLAVYRNSWMEPLDDRYLYANSFNIRSWTGFLIDLQNGNWVDTGSFAVPAQYMVQKGVPGIFRMQGAVLSKLDTELRPISTVVFEEPPIHWEHHGDKILIMDRVKDGLLTMVHLKDLHIEELHILLELIDSAQVAGLDRDIPVRCDAAIDVSGNVILALYDVWEPSLSRLYALRQGRLIATENVVGSVSLEVDTSGSVVAICHSTLVWAFNGSVFTHSSGESLVKYKLTTSEVFEVIQEDPDKVRMDLREDRFDDRVVRKQGSPIFSSNVGNCQICDSVLYSTHRAVDHFEAFPLSGKEVIRQVRDEKKFGEFWKHINIDPLIQKALE